MSENQFVNTITPDPPAKHSKTSMFFSLMGSLAFLVYFFVLPTFRDFLSHNAETIAVPLVGILFWLLYAAIYLVMIVAVITIGFSMYFAAFVTALTQKSYWSALLVAVLAGALTFYFGLPHLVDSLKVLFDQ